MTDWTAASIAKALHKAPRKSGTNWMTLCPAHADKGFSLSLRDKTKDHVIVNCLAGCDFRDIIKALHDRNIQLPSGRSNFKATAVKTTSAKSSTPPSPAPIEEEKEWVHAPERACECKFELSSLGKIANQAKAVYEWREKSGDLLFYTIRFQRPDGTKNVLPVTPCVHVKTKTLQWRLQGPEGLRPFYNRENDRDQPIVMVLEGEKTADAGKKLFASQDTVWVTTTLGGCKSPHLVDWSPMKGRKIVIPHDMDAAGLTYAATVSANCYAAGAASCQLLTLRADEIISGGRPRPRNGDFPEGYDMADALDEKWTLPLLLNQNRPWHGPLIRRSI